MRIPRESNLRSFPFRESGRPYRTQPDFAPMPGEFKSFTTPPAQVRIPYIINKLHKDYGNNLHAWLQQFYS
jgi:hypothetical protein